MSTTATAAVASKTARKGTSRIGKLLGLGTERFQKPPQLVALADGLVVTDTAAEAWFVLQASNTDLMAESDQDREQVTAALTLAKALPGYQCHLKVLWTRLDGEVYRAEARELFTAGDVEKAAGLWAERLNDLDLPQRHLLLGVRIAERDSTTNATVKNATTHALGTAHTGITTAELAQLAGQVRRVERKLESPWRATVAPVELLAWAISRESHRPLPAPPRLPEITGAALRRLTASRALPYSDHLQLMGNRGEIAAWVAVLAMPSFPAQMVTPGEQEWLRCLSDIHYPDPQPPIDPVTGRELSRDIPVCPEASVRFEVWPKGQAIKDVDKQRKKAKEQRKSAGEGSAGETLAETEETEAAMIDLRHQMVRGDLTLLEDHPRLIVTSTLSLEDLHARCDAVIAHYAGIGIDVCVAVDEQRELWLETQIGDQLRVADLGHIRTTEALAASMFWGGSEAGDRSGPIVGLLTGTTPGVCRFDITAGPSRGDGTTTAFIGRSGRGKTTAMMLTTLNAALKGAFALMLGFKGDEAGLIRAGEYLGIASHQVRCGIDTPGVADLFRMDLPERDAVLDVVSQMLIMLPERMREAGVEVQLTAACNQIATHPDPGSWRVIELLEASHDPLAREAGQALAQLAQTPLGAPVLGKPSTDTAVLRPEPGLWLVQIPGLNLPQPGTAPRDMSPAQRVSLALMRGLIAYGLNTSARLDLRQLPKLICIPEVHVLTSTSDGRQFLDYVARTGRALDTSFGLDTQDSGSFKGLDGVLEAITTLFAFELSTKEQQDALIELLHLPPGQASRDLIHGLGKSGDGSVRHGHCIIRDHQDRLATLQFDAPHTDLLRLLSTNAKDHTNSPSEAALEGQAA
ncbi:ATP-binding protein [Streptomyces sp. N35]|uniref:ATP-binding protein n=1 Tax=Streptomyces sp. N35 TaxID=2795730 RepID=UPI0018F6F0B9|nr:ATP-binding protein [Streptomyces sp. N35]